MAKIVLKNPYFEEEIKVKESHKRIADMLNWMEQGNLDFMTLQQVEPSENIITLNPKHFGKIEIYEDEEIKKMKLKEVEIPEIPQFIANWVDNLKSGLFGLNYDSVPSKIYDWVYAEEENIKKLHLAVVVGYKIKEEE